MALEAAVKWIPERHDRIVGADRGKEPTYNVGHEHQLRTRVGGDGDGEEPAQGEGSPEQCVQVSRFSGADRFHRFDGERINVVTVNGL